MKRFSYWLSSTFLLSMLVTSCQPAVSHITPAPTPQCIEPTLTLGNKVFHVVSVPRAVSSFPDIPEKEKDTAFWVEGTTINYIFALSPTEENLALDQTLKAGDPAVITWADCSKDEYVITSVGANQPIPLNIFDQSAGGITVYVQPDAFGLVIHGDRPGVQSQETAAPVSGPQFDITIVNDLEQVDDKTLRIGFVIDNRGTQALTIANTDVSLTPEGGSPLFPLTVEPGLPKEIQPGGSLALDVTFSKPDASSAVFRILDVTFDYYFR